MKRYTGPNGEDMVVVDLDEVPPMTPDELARLEAIRDEDIDFSDIPSLADDEDFWENATIGWPPPRKVHVTMRLDEDTIAYFKRGGRRYQSRINAVLRAYVAAQLRTEEKQAVEKRATEAVANTVAEADKTSS